MSLRACIGLAFVLTLVGCASVETAAGLPPRYGPPPPGWYSSVRQIPETGGQSGMRLEVLQGGPEPAVVFVNCAELCLEVKPLVARVEGDGLAFTVLEAVTDAEGRRLRPASYRVLARAERTGILGEVVVHVTLPGRPDLPAQLLRPVEY